MESVRQTFIEAVEHVNVCILFSRVLTISLRVMLKRVRFSIISNRPPRPRLDC